MKNFKLTIEYDGAVFKGWQRQAQGERTVQGDIEKTLAKIFKVDSISVIASGRTDSGVHALGQVAHVKAKTRMTAQQLHHALNAWLPKEVSILNIREVPLDFHAQYSVKHKTYRYHILNRAYPSALWRERALFYPYPLYISLMKKAAKQLVGTHDFKSFQAVDPLRVDKGTVRTVKTISIKTQGDLILIDITADGFLYKMVRNMVGTLLAVGRKQIKPQDVTRILNAKNRNQARNTAPAQGLALLKVVY